MTYASWFPHPLRIRKTFSFAVRMMLILAKGLWPVAQREVDKLHFLRVAQETNVRVDEESGATKAFPSFKYTTGQSMAKTLST